MLSKNMHVFIWNWTLSDKNKVHIVLGVLYRQYGQNTQNVARSDAT